MSKDMTFEQAMAAARAGRMVRRARWGRKKQDAYLLDAEAIAACDWMIVDAEPVTQVPLVTDEHAELEDRDVFTMMRNGRDIARKVVDDWAHHNLASAVNELADWAEQVDSMLDGWVARYTAAFRVEADPETIPGAQDDGDVLVGPAADPERVLTELTLDELTKGPLTDLPTLADGLPAVPESGDVPLPNGCRLYWRTDNSINTRVYSSDEVGGGVEVWNPALVSEDTLLAAIVTESQLGRLEFEHARRRTEGTIMRPSAKTFSIFGQIEAAAAEVMITNGDITKIPTEQIPASVRVNAAGQHALFAVIVPADKLGRFEELIEKLYA